VGDLFETQHPCFPAIEHDRIFAVQLGESIVFLFVLRALIKLL
jgi:hypothetical protein